jgi:radical SAM protein with 4Fe4S-binding SPASM domain
MNTNQLKRVIFSSPKRQWNLAKVYASYLLRRPQVWGRPIRLMIEPANFCNLGCPTCPVGNGQITKAKGLMKFEDFKKVIDEVGGYLYHLTLWNWGEPFLNRDLPKMIAYARAKGIYVATSTNGHFLTPETAEAIIDSGLNELIIALDGLSPETLSVYRINSDFAKIVEGIKNVVRIKKERGRQHPVIELQFIVMKHNEHELPRLNDFAKELGLDKVVIKTFGSQLDLDRVSEFAPANKEVSRYGKELRKRNSCLNVWRAMNVNYDGNAVPCCYDPFEKFKVGNVLTDGGVDSVWHGKRFVNFRQAILTDKEALSICRNCDFNKDVSKKLFIK